MMLKKQLLRMSCGVLFLFSLVDARASLTIEITKGQSNPIPIAIAPFKINNAAPSENLEQIVMNNLERSGAFSPVPHENMLSQPSQFSEVNIRDWRILKVDYLVVGHLQYIAAEQKYLVNYELIDTISNQVIATQTLRAPENQLRDLAHTISDQLYKQLTGIEGIFSTRLLYITVKRIADRQQEYHLYMADIDGERQRLILKSNEPILSPSWSPNGKKIAYVSFEKKRPAIFVQEVATGAREQVTNFSGLNSAPAWSPDGESLALVLSKDGNPEIYVMNLMTKALTRMTNHYAVDTEPSWAADGHSLVFTSDRGGKPQIYHMDVASKKIKRLTFSGNYNARGQLSADGKNLIMVHQADGVFHIARQDMQRGTIKILTDSNLDESPSMAPNSNMLIYATQLGQKGVLSVVSFDGNSRYVLPFSAGDVREPAWSPFFHH